MITLSSSVQFVKGVGAARAETLRQKAIQTVEDLLVYLPFRYEDRTRLRGPSEVRAGEVATVITRVRSAGMLPVRRSRVQIFCADVGERGAYFRCKWFNSAWLERMIRPGQYVALHGKVEFDAYEGGLQMIQPQFEILPSVAVNSDTEGIGADGHSLEVGRIVPIYEAAGKGRLTSRFFRHAVYSALESLAGIEDPLPRTVSEQLGLLSRYEAFRNAHFPPPGTRLADLDSFRSPAQIRLIFEEFFLLETGLALRKKRAQEEPGIAFRTNERIRESLKRILPFRPTAAQKRVLGEIVEDMRASRPMFRLLQGDVGCGKTLVALQAAVIAIENGYQVAVMAPTEILAAQHFFYFRRLLAQSGYTSVLLSGSAGLRAKRAAKKLLREGAAQIAIGTHALIEGDVEFKALGLVIIDEQHRFGVMQRLRLMQKAQTPDTLVMTATPIPRTLALTLYGDLDVSVIDEMPAGRRPIRTRQIPSEAADQAYEFARAQVAEGAQVFVVCPVIEDTSGLGGTASSRPNRRDASDLKSALRMHEHLAKRVFPGIPVGLLHGRMTSEEKERAMSAFQAGELPILVGTTVVEVGVDVPNATVMIIEQADRFGLAQLHQLRGRVGRGARQSHCLLLASRDLSEAGRQRLAALEQTLSGFEIAELDMRLRGPGEFLGTRQSGLPALRVANLLRDREILEQARHLALDFVDRGERKELNRLASYIKDSWNRRQGLIRVG